MKECIEGSIFYGYSFDYVCPKKDALAKIRWERWGLLNPKIHKESCLASVYPISGLYCRTLLSTPTSPCHFLEYMHIFLNKKMQSYIDLETEIYFEIMHCWRINSHSNKGHWKYIYKFENSSYCLLNIHLNNCYFALVKTDNFKIVMYNDGSYRALSILYLTFGNSEMMKRKKK